MKHPTWPPPSPCTYIHVYKWTYATDRCTSGKRKRKRGGGWAPKFSLAYRTRTNTSGLGPEMHMYIGEFPSWETNDFKPPTTHSFYGRCSASRTRVASTCSKARRSSTASIWKAPNSNRTSRCVRKAPRSCSRRQDPYAAIRPTRIRNPRGSRNGKWYDQHNPSAKDNFWHIGWRFRPNTKLWDFTTFEKLNLRCRLFRFEDYTKFFMRNWGYLLFKLYFVEYEYSQYLG